MKTVGKTSSRCRPAPHKRVLVWLLLMPMLYAVTIGSVHADAAFLPESSVQVSDHAVRSVEYPVQGRQHDSGCLLCLLGQQLSSTTLATNHFVDQPAPPAKVITSQPSLGDEAPPRSRTIELFFGRAPPFRQSVNGAGLDK